VTKIGTVDVYECDVCHELWTDPATLCKWHWDGDHVDARNRATLDRLSNPGDAPYEAAAAAVAKFADVPAWLLAVAINAALSAIIDPAVAADPKNEDA